MAQTDRNVLFANEAFVLGMLQAVSAGAVVAALAQSETLVKWVGRTSFFFSRRQPVDWMSRVGELHAIVVGPDDASWASPTRVLACSADAGPWAAPLPAVAPVAWKATIRFVGVPLIDIE
jgi:hypothetical protein